MQKPILKTLDFNGKPIYYLTIDGTNYVLIRPLCEALGVDAERQIKNIADDEMLVHERSEQTVHVPGDDKSRKWICLPEEYVYGFIFGIKFTNTMGEETKAALTAYKRECYDVLYRHFHGRSLLQKEVNREKAAIELELGQLKNELIAADPRFSRYLHLLTRKQQATYRASKLQSDQVAQIMMEFVDEEEEAA